MHTNAIIARPFSFGHVVGRVDLCCCYCCPTKAAVVAAADNRNYAAFLSLLLCSYPTVVQTHPLLLNNSGQATSRGNYSRGQRTSGCNKDWNNKETTADNEQQTGVRMMGTTATDYVGIWQCGPI
jgi:hypothetical protein